MIFQQIILNAAQGKRKFTSLYDIYGLWGAIKYISKNLLFIETVCRLDKNLHEAEKIVHPKIPIKIGILKKGLILDEWNGKEDILSIRGIYGLEQFAKRFNRGDLCFVAYSHDDFAGFVWVEFPPVTEAGYSLQSAEAFTYDGWTFEKFRGNRVLPVLQQAIFAYVRVNRPDICSIATHVAIWNKASLSGDQRAGYKITRLERTIVLLGFHKKVPLNREIPNDLIMHQN